MKVIKWWRDNRVLEKRRFLRYWNEFLWCMTWIRVNLLTIGVERKELKIACALGNLSYKKMKKSGKKNELKK